MFFTHFHRSLLVYILCIACTTSLFAQPNTSIDLRQGSSTTYTYEFSDPDGIQMIQVTYGDPRNFTPPFKPVRMKTVFRDLSCPTAVTLVIDRSMTARNQPIQLSEFLVVDCKGGDDPNNETDSATLWEIGANGTTEQWHAVNYPIGHAELLDRLNQEDEEFAKWEDVREMLKILKFLKCLTIIILILLLILILWWFIFGPFFKPRDPTVHDF